MTRVSSVVMLIIALLAAPLTAEAQSAKEVHRIGFLGNSTPALEANLVGRFARACASWATSKGTTFSSSINGRKEGTEESGPKREEAG
jgi:hypothetical protein